MTLVKEMLAELVGMFVGSARLTTAILALVALAAGVVRLAGIEPLIAGAALLFGCLILLVENVRRAGRQSRSR